MYKVTVEKVTGDGRIVLMDRRVELVKATETISGEDLTKLRGLREGRVVDVIVVVHDDPSSAADCIRAMYRHEPQFDWRLTVVDNACDEFTTKTLRRLRSEHGRKFNWLKMRQYNGHLPAMHVAVGQTSGDWLVFVNQRVVVTAGWLEGIMWAAHSGTRVGMVSPWSTKRILPEDGSNYESVAARVRAGARRKSSPTSFPMESCFAVKRQALMACGGFDVEYYGPGYGESADLYLRLVHAKWAAVRANSSYVLDETPGRTEAGPWLNGEAAGRERFLARWGNEPFKLHSRLMEADDVLDAAGRVFGARVAKRPTVVFCFRDFELCGATLAATHICNRLIDLGWDASFAFCRVAPGHSLRHLPMRFKPWQFESRQGLVKGLRARLEDAVLVAPTWINVEDVMKTCSGRGDLVPVYYVQDDERRFRRPSGKPYASASDIETMIKLVPNRIANSEWVRRMVEDLDCECGRIPIGVDSLMFRPGDRPTDRVRVMAHCRPSTPRRGWPFIQAVINRAARDADFEFVAYDQPYESTEMAVPCHGNLGQIAPGDLARHMQTAHVFVEGSEYQGFGMQALEAMACGCALLSTRNGGVYEYGRGGENCLLVKHGDVDGAARMLVKLVEDRKLRDAVGDVARKTAARFDWRNIVVRWDQYCRSLLNGKT